MSQTPKQLMDRELARQIVSRYKTTAHHDALQEVGRTIVRCSRDYDKGLLYELHAGLQEIEYLHDHRRPTLFEACTIILGAIQELDNRIASRVRYTEELLNRMYPNAKEWWETPLSEHGEDTPKELAYREEWLPVFEAAEKEYREWERQ